MRESIRTVTPGAGLCAGVGFSFTKRIRLATPIGKRGLVDPAEAPSEERIKLEPIDPPAARRLQQRFDS